MRWAITGGALRESNVSLMLLRARLRIASRVRKKTTTGKSGGGASVSYLAVFECSATASHWIAGERTEAGLRKRGLGEQIGRQRSINTANNTRLGRFALLDVVPSSRAR